MLEWLFGRKDTAESLAREVYGFFDVFQRLQARIETLVLVNKEAEVKEFNLNRDKKEELSTTLDNALARASEVYDEDFTREQKRYSSATEKLTTEMETLSGSLRLATKVVNFAVEE